MEKDDTALYYSLTEAIILRLFPLGRKTLYNLIKAGQRFQAGEKETDYVIALNVGTPDRTIWRVSEDELREWLERRQAMLGTKGLQKPKKPRNML